MNTILSGSSGSLVSFFFKPFFLRKITPLNNYNPISICNGLLSGLVAITAACDNVQPWSAIIIGIVSGLVYITACWIMGKLKIDDPMDNVMVHGFVGFFDMDNGLFYTKSFCQLGI